MKTCLNLIGFLLVIFLCETSFALTPPRLGEIEQYRNDGSYAERLNRAYQLGNHKTDPHLILDTQRRLYELQGIPAPDGLPAPPPAWQGGLPAFGSPKVLVILVDFPEYPHDDSQTVADVQSKMFGSGVPADAPYESLRTFYQRSSYSQLNITGTVLGWYRATHDRYYYQTLDDRGTQALIKEAFDYYNTQGHDFSQYDSDNDGFIDAFFIKWTGPDNGWANFWWAYQGYFSDNTYSVDGKHLGKFVWSWYYNPGDTAYRPSTDIHETGHLLGLPDYYDYDNTVGPRGGVGGLDMMDSVSGDHNSFSKFMLDWFDPTVVASGTQTKTLNPSGASGDAVLIMPNATAATPFAEFFMAQYRKRGVGNDPNNYLTNGLVIWHVDAHLDASGTNFQYNNSFTAHKLLRLMEADGLEEIEQNMWANAGDFYLPPQTFGPGTTPNSNNYLGQDTQVIVDSLTIPAATLSARFAIGGATCNYAISPTSQTFAAAGGTGAVNVAADAGCAWTATGNNWIAVTAGGSGNGNGTVNYTVAANTDPNQRTGALTIAGKTFTIFTITQSGTGGGTLPDLVVTLVTSPGSGVAGEQINVAATVKNQGAQATGYFLVVFYLSRDSTITLSDTSMRTGCSIDSLAAGESITCPPGLFRIVIPATVSSGTYYLGAYADSDDTVGESNEINNGLAAANTTTITGGSTYTLTLAKTGTGSGTVSGGGNYAAGATVTLTATPTAGSAFVGWGPTPCAPSFTMPANNLTCTAIFNAGSSGLLLAGLTANGQIYYTTNLSTWTQVPGELVQLRVGDLNGDGKTDLAGLASNGSIWYTTNLNDWANIPGQLAQLRVGDFNGDGHADLAGLASNGSIWYTTNLHDWANVPGQLAQLRVGDFNGDGKADLAGLAGNGSIWYTTNLNDWANVPGQLAQLQVGDFNGDGKADLAGLAGNGSIWYTTNLNGWANVPGQLAQLQVGDLNGDGHADLVGLASNGSIWYTTNGAWTQIPGGLNRLRVGDLNGDGHADLAGLAGNGSIWYTTNLGAWTQIPGQLNRLAGDD
ncbi:MAG: M6 family metalloprotease domain-containing protein [Candidatus Contendobacter sp.]